MPYLKSKKYSTFMGHTIYTYQCNVCTFTAEDPNKQVAINTTLVHEIGHEFGQDNSKAFPKTIDQHRANEERKKKEK